MSGEFVALNPLSVCLLIAAAAASYCFLSGLLTGENSAVDRQWSVIPLVYVAVFVYSTSSIFSSPRVAIVASLVAVWGVRLTYNFWRKGGYNGEEDYRWAVLRKMIPNRFLFALFNLFFISIYQHLLILLFTLPIAMVWTLEEAGSAAPLNPLDGFFFTVCLACISFETIADQQQWEFQQSKYNKIPRLANLEHDYKLGFRTTGLFSLSRHPNFFAEQSFWVFLCGFPIAAGAPIFHWTLIGAVLLVILFQGSTNFTEDITLRKYPQYAKYQQTTSRLLPWFAGPSIPVHDD